MIQCNKKACKKRYIGETKRSLAKRLSEHKGRVTTARKINNDLSQVIIMTQIMTRSNEY
jgi:hypothetical protein